MLEGTHGTKQMGHLGGEVRLEKHTKPKNKNNKKALSLRANFQTFRVLETKFGVKCKNSDCISIFGTNHSL